MMNWSDNVHLMLLNNMQYQFIMINTYLTQKKNFENIQFTIGSGLFYETLLMIIRGETVRFSKQKARKTC